MLCSLLPSPCSQQEKAQGSLAVGVSSGLLLWGHCGAQAVCAANSSWMESSLDFVFWVAFYLLVKRLLFHWIVPTHCLHNVCSIAKCPSIGNELFLHHQFVSMDEEEGSCHITKWCHWLALIKQGALEWGYGFISICMAFPYTHLNLQGHSLRPKAAGLLSIFYLQSWIVTPHLLSQIQGSFDKLVYT